jgi:hypothetical protein
MKRTVLIECNHFQVFHDIATHNIEDGTGGMDASIRFSEEQERPEVC